MYTASAGGLDPGQASIAAKRFPLLARNGTVAEFNERDEGTWRGSFCFVQAADSQLGMMNNFANKYAKPCWSQEVELMKRLVERVNRLQPRPRFLIVCGDLVDAMPDVSYKADQVRDFKAVLADLHADIRPLCVCGNHDIGDVPSEQSIGQYQRDFGDDYYDFWVGGVKFIVINSQFYQDDSLVRQLSAEHARWLDGQLARPSRWTHLVGFQHIPPFVYERDEEAVYVFDNYALNFNFRKDVREPFLRKLKAAGMNKLFCGHFHRNAGGWDDQLEVVVTTAVGCQLGSDPHGARIVRVFQDRIDHTFYAIDDLPETVDLSS